MLEQNDMKADESTISFVDDLDDKETLEIRIKTLDRQEKALRDKYNTMQDQLSKALGQGAPAQPDEN